MSLIPQQINATCAPSIVTNATIRILVEFACQGTLPTRMALVLLAQLTVKAANLTLVA